MNEIPKVVFSNSLASADWGETTIAAGDLAEAVTRLKQERSGGYLLAHGGARFARSLVETGLIDEYRLVVHPVVLGAGERLFTRAAHHRADEHHRLQRRSRRPRLRGRVIEPVSPASRAAARSATAQETRPLRRRSSASREAPGCDSPARSRRASRRVW